MSEKKIYKENEDHHNDLIKLQKESLKEEKVADENYIISLKNINKIYDNHVQAVFDFNLDIKKNEFIVFVGPSGYGKSTTLRMIAGLEDITYGDLYMYQQFANNLLPKDRHIGMVFQSYALYPHMSVFENMAFALEDCYKHTPDPKIVILAGACAISGGVFQNSTELNREFLDKYPIDLYIPGCPVHPLTFINGVLSYISQK